MLMVYVQCDNKAPINASLEALTEAVALSKDDVTAVLIGSFDEATENTCKEYGATRIIEVPTDTYNLQASGKILKTLVEKYSPKLVIAGGTSMAKDILGFASAKLEATALSNVNDIKMGDEIEFTIALYGGSILRDVTINNDKARFAILSSGAFKKLPNPATNTEIIKENIEEKDLKTIIKEAVTEIAESVNLEDAEKIVACGRGMDTDEGYKLIEELADTLGAAIGATRPVTESGRVTRTQQIGQSGKTVSPKLYIGCGVSGATQHLSGILGSDYIIAINKDEDAAIFDVADVGIVGDAMAVLPLFIEEIKKLK